MTGIDHEHLISLLDPGDRRDDAGHHQAGALLHRSDRTIVGHYHTF